MGELSDREPDVTGDAPPTNEKSPRSNATATATTIATAAATTRPPPHRRHEIIYFTPQGCSDSESCPIRRFTCTQ